MTEVLRIPVCAFGKKENRRCDRKRSVLKTADRPWKKQDDTGGYDVFIYGKSSAE